MAVLEKPSIPAVVLQAVVAQHVVLWCCAVVAAVHVVLAPPFHSGKSCTGLSNAIRMPNWGTPGHRVVISPTGLVTSGQRHLTRLVASEW